MENNRKMLKKIFNKHVFSNLKSKSNYIENKHKNLEMKTGEVNRILMSLNIFPDLLTNVEITRIIGEILKTTTSSVIKSPRIFSKDSERKESTLSFSDFEKMMVKIAVKAFKNSEDPVSFCINKIYRKIILMSKCIYF